jgi:hypothetical protein
MQKKELEDELERTEEEYEEQIANINESNRAECQTLEGLLSSLKLQQSIQLKAQSDGFDISTIDLANQYTLDISMFKESMTDIEAQSKHLLNENKELQTRVNKAKLEFETQCRENSDLVSFNEKINDEFKRQTTEMEGSHEKNSRLQRSVDNLLFEKRNAEIAEFDKDSKMDEVMKLLDEKNRRLTEANAEKSNALNLASAEVIRLSEESELRARSFTELWSSKEGVDVSEKKLMSQIRELNTNLSRAHEEINTNVSKIDGLNEIIDKFSHDTSISNRKISELEETSSVLEGKLLASQSEFNTITVTHRNLEVEHRKLDSSHVMVSSQLVEERIAKKAQEEEVTKERDIWLSCNDEHKKALKKEENNAHILMQSLEEKKAEMISTELKLNLVKEELLASHSDVEKLTLQEENNKNILGAFKLRLKDTKSSLEISQNDSLIATNKYDTIKEELQAETASYNQELAAKLSLLDAADKTKMKLLEEIGEISFDLIVLLSLLKYLATSFWIRYSFLYSIFLAVLGAEISTASTEISQLQKDLCDASGANRVLEERICNQSKEIINVQISSAEVTFSNSELLDCVSDLEGKVDVLKGVVEAKEKNIIKISEDVNNLSKALFSKSAEVEKSILMQRVAGVAYEEEARKMDLKIKKFEEDIASKDSSLGIAQKLAMEEKEQHILAQNMATATVEVLRQEIASYQVIIVNLEKEIATCQLSLTQSLSNNKVLIEDKTVLESTKDEISLSLIESEGAYAALLGAKNMLILEMNEETNKVVRTVEELSKMTATVQQHETSMNNLRAINMSSEVAIIGLNEEISKKEKDASLAAQEAVELKKHLVDLSDKVVSTAEKLDIIVNEKGRLKVELKGSIEEFRKMKLMHVELETLVEKQKGEKVSLLGDLKDYRMKSTITINESKRRNDELSSRNEELDDIMELKSKLNDQLEKQLAESVRLYIIYTDYVYFTY